MTAPVIAAVDPATGDLAPARLGAMIAGHAGAPLLVAGVFASDAVVGPSAAGQLGEELPRDVEEALARVLAELRPDGVEVESVAIGATSAPRGLALAAEEVGALIVVVGSAVDRPDGRLAPGSTAARLLDGTPCPVGLVPRGWTGPIRVNAIGVGFVDTAEGRDAVRQAHALAARAGATLRVLAAVHPHAWMGEGSSIDDVRTRVEQAAADATADLLGAPVDVDVSVGEPADVLVGASDELGLLVCGARGYGPSGATSLGGVTRRVTAEARCPVAVLTRGGGRLDAFVGPRDSG
jgi:nucleotide-binding universal stress UspA family protein